MNRYVVLYVAFAILVGIVSACLYAISMAISG